MMIGDFNRILRKLIKRPFLFKEFLYYIKNDLSSLLGIYRYDHHVLYIAGLPKSGTTWLQTMLARIPGYNIRPINDPNGVALNHDICVSIFSSLPKYGYTVLAQHTRYSPENFEIIRHYIPKFVVMYRDLRDMCLSRYFHVKADHTHRHHMLYNTISLEEGISHSVAIIDEEYVSWVSDWLDIADLHRDTILSVRYEDLNTRTFETLKKVFTFYDLSVGDDFIAFLAATKLKKEKNLADELGKGIGRYKSTARKGIVGDWRKYFSDTHKNKFKEIAGDVLIRLNYEHSFDW